MAAYHKVGELRASLSRGRWHRDWGIPPVTPASVGAEIEVLLPRSDNQWTKLTATLAGLLCASINLIEKQTTIVPQLSNTATSSRNILRDGVKVRGILPGETVCTENLTPWSKLLPCSSFAGLSMLLNPLQIFDSTFHQFDINLQALCIEEKGCERKELVLEQNLLVVFDLTRRNDPLNWSLQQFFDRKVTKLCPAASSSIMNFVKPSENDAWKVLNDDVEVETRIDDDGKINMELNGNGKIKVAKLNGLQFVDRNLKVINIKPADFTLPHSPLYAHRHLSGIGQERGGLVITWQNRSPEDIQVTHSELLPHYMHLFLSMAHFRVDKAGDLPISFARKLIYAPAISRQRPSQLELQLTIPAGKSISLEIPFEKIFLRYTDYPFDPNRGFDLPGATIEYTISNHTFRHVTPKLLLTMPSPDFTMPYNVITLTSTLIVLFYGTFFNLTFRRFYTGSTRLALIKRRAMNSIKNIILKLRSKRHQQ